MKHEIIHGDCLDIMKSMQDNSIDFVVSDPPYGLHFMSKSWDKETPSMDIWKEMLRICKPGSWAAVFGGSRTHHRTMVALEDAGWEIRDVIIWLYGSGFPKSHNKFGLEGYGTALKPAYEPIILCMKPLDGTFKQNAEKHGVAGINIDECRIESNDDLTRNCLGYASAINEGYKRPYHDNAEKKLYGSINGRWPANIILDEEAAQLLDQQSGYTISIPHINKPQDSISKFCTSKNMAYSLYDDSGGASRFFYCAKTSPSERNGSTHPTMKPLSLMRYILKLLAPPNNPICLDPFAGSGTTVLAAQQLGISCIGIEKEKEYCDIANKRLELVLDI